MRFVDFVSADAIRVPLSAREMEGALRELVEALVRAGEIGEPFAEDLMAAILKRERAASSRIGRSVAIPHARHRAAPRVVGTLGVSRDGIDFENRDGEAVQVVFLLVVPPGSASGHLRALERISRSLGDEEFECSLRESQSADDVWRLLEESDREPQSCGAAHAASPFLESHA